MQASQGEEQKEQSQRSWSSAVPGWRKHDALLSRSATPVSAALLERAGVEMGMHVLDMACGSGEPALRAAARVGTSGSVLGIDRVEEVLAFAREKAKEAGLANLEFRQADAELPGLPHASFDAATMQFGLMLLDEPMPALRAIRVALKPGARLAVATWAGPERNPWLGAVLPVLARLADVEAPGHGAPGIFALADPDRLRSVLEQAGFRGVEVAPLEFTQGETDSAEFAEFVVEAAGPLLEMSLTPPPELRAQALQEVAAALQPFQDAEGQLELPAAAWIAFGAR